MTFYLIDNFSDFGELGHVDENILTKIRAAQRDHVSIDFKTGVVRIILPDVTNDVVGGNSVRKGSFTQRCATLIANEYNLQPFLFKHDSVFSLVIVSQLDGPVSDTDAVARRLERMKIF